MFLVVRFCRPGARCRPQSVLLDGAVGFDIRIHLDQERLTSIRLIGSERRIGLVKPAPDKASGSKVKRPGQHFHFGRGLANHDAHRRCQRHFLADVVLR